MLPNELHNPLRAYKGMSRDVSCGESGVTILIEETTPQHKRNNEFIAGAVTSLSVAARKVLVRWCMEAVCESDTAMCEKKLRDYISEGRKGSPVITGNGPLFYVTADGARVYYTAADMSGSGQPSDGSTAGGGGGSISGGSIGSGSSAAMPVADQLALIEGS